jgi:hypothetical protein
MQPEKNTAKPTRLLFLFGWKEVMSMADKPLISEINDVSEKIKQARKKVEDLEMRLRVAYEELLKRRGKEQ